jgi:hypothetical protein
MTDHHEDAAVRPAVLDDVPALVACSAALFAEDAGTRDASTRSGKLCGVRCENQARTSC